MIMTSVCLITEVCFDTDSAYTPRPLGPGSQGPWEGPRGLPAPRRCAQNTAAACGRTASSWDPKSIEGLEPTARVHPGPRAPPSCRNTEAG